MPDERLAIAIVNYNSEPHLLRCLASIESSRCDAALQVSVWDNASADTLEDARRAYPEVAMTCSPRNVGFAAASNALVQQTESDWVLLLNPDMLLPADALQAMLDFLRTNPEAAAVGPHLVREDGSTDLACRRSFPTPASALCKLAGLSRVFPRSRRFSRYNLTYLDAYGPMEVDAVCGACMLLRRSIWDALGGMDEDYFLYGEDLDLCYRLRREGHAIYYLPDVQATHVKGASAASAPVEASRAFHEAMLIFYRKHYRGRYARWVGWAIHAGVRLNYAATRLRLMCSPRRGPVMRGDADLPKHEPLVRR